MKLVQILPQYGNLDKIKLHFEHWYDVNVRDILKLGFVPFITGNIPFQIGYFTQYFVTLNIGLSIDILHNVVTIQVLDRSILSEQDRIGYDALDMYTTMIKIENPHTGIDGLNYLTAHAICTTLRFINT